MLIRFSTRAFLPLPLASDFSKRRESFKRITGCKLINSCANFSE
ncbi:Uncharacterised protein [Vibrio cholerae]|nr:Uncharacterised protein [Vibrio cholerae]